MFKLYPVDWAQYSDIQNSLSISLLTANLYNIILTALSQFKTNRLCSSIYDFHI